MVVWREWLTTHMNVQGSPTHTEHDLIPRTVSLGSCSFSIYLHPAKNEKSGQSREGFPGSYAHYVIVTERGAD